MASITILQLIVSIAAPTIAALLALGVVCVVTHATGSTGAR